MKQIVKVIILIIICFTIITLAGIWHEEDAIETQSYRQNKISNSVIEVEIDRKIYEWEETQKGYDVIAKLEIPSINLKTNVLSNYSNEALLISVTKFWGANPNEIGNFCIAGHNYYKRNNMFYKLKKLKKGDEILLTDRKNLTISYEVYSVTKVEPRDVSCLSQETNGKREITLITCTSDSKMRIIVKAVEK